MSFQFPLENVNDGGFPDFKRDGVPESFGAACSNELSPKVFLKLRGTASK